MNARLLTRVLGALHAQLEPPGCEVLEFEHPLLPGHAISVALVHEHRFAFHYWLQWGLPLAESGARPDLVTLDFHDDVGGECDYDPRTLERLDVSDRNEIAMFCWAGLRLLNDGHVAPAAHLGAIGNVHAVVRQGWSHDQRESERVQVIRGRRGGRHTVRYHRSPNTLIRCLSQNGSCSNTILDIDLDYFTRDHKSEVLNHQIRLSDRAVKHTLSRHRPLMAHLWPTVVGITIALEPRHCGGWRNCMRNLDAVLRALFPGQRR